MQHLVHKKNIRMRNFKPDVKLSIWNPGSGGAAGHFALCMKHKREKYWFSFSTNEKFFNKCGVQQQIGYFKVPDEELKGARKKEFNVAKLEVKLKTHAEDSKRGRPDTVITFDPLKFNIKEMIESAKMISELSMHTFYQIATAQGAVITGDEGKKLVPYGQGAVSPQQNEAQNCVSSALLLLDEGGSLNLSYSYILKIANTQLHIATDHVLLTIPFDSVCHEKEKNPTPTEMYENDEFEDDEFEDEDL